MSSDEFLKDLCCIGNRLQGAQAEAERPMGRFLQQSGIETVMTQSQIGGSEGALE